MFVACERERERLLSEETNFTETPAVRRWRSTDSRFVSFRKAMELCRNWERRRREIGRDLMLRRNLTLCVCVFHQRERLMTTTSQQESRVMQSGICDDVFFLFSLENATLLCSELQQGFDLKAGSKSRASPLTTCCLNEIVASVMINGYSRYGCKRRIA